jgi:hypothetical protein
MIRVAELVISRPLDRVQDRRVRRELRRAAFHAALATRRARSIGPLSAAGDRRVARGIRRASAHATRAAALAVAPPPSHRLRNALLIASGTGAAIAVVAVWRRSDRPRSEEFATMQGSSEATGGVEAGEIEAPPGQ